MSIDSEALLHEFRQAVPYQHSVPQAAMESSPGGAIQHRAVAYQAWLESQADIETPALSINLFRHWVTADIISWRSLDPNSSKKTVAALRPDISAYDTYAELQMELDSSLYDEFFSRSLKAESINGFTSTEHSDERRSSPPVTPELRKSPENVTHPKKLDGRIVYLINNVSRSVHHIKRIHLHPSVGDNHVILTSLRTASERLGDTSGLLGSDEFTPFTIQSLIDHDGAVRLAESTQKASNECVTGLSSAQESGFQHPIRQTRLCRSLLRSIRPRQQSAKGSGLHTWLPSDIQEDL